MTAKNGIYYSVRKKSAKHYVVNFIRETEQQAWKALQISLTWSNCFDTRFEPSLRELKREWDIVKLELKEQPK